MNRKEASDFVILNELKAEKRAVGGSELINTPSIVTNIVDSISEFYKNVIELIPNGVAIFDLEEYVIFSNKKILEEFHINSPKNLSDYLLTRHLKDFDA